jgi:exonuclease SbcD
LKIAITADCHLTTRKDHPERYQALTNILDQLVKTGIGTLVIAGDLFQQQSRNYAEFERLCSEKQYRELRFIIIPGNHDPQLSQRNLSASNVRIVSETELFTIPETKQRILFIPYGAGKSMGDEIGRWIKKSGSEPWCLISHGDWIEGMATPNPDEPGVYMPLTRSDLEVYKPVHAILGHIHKPTDGAVYYPGSPCPLNINETGLRRFLVLDTEDLSLDSKPVDSPRLYFNEIFTNVPVEGEADTLRKQIESRMEGWGIDRSDRSRVRLRIRVRGYTADREKISEILEATFKGYAYYHDEGPDLTELFTADDPEREELVTRIAERIEQLPWPCSEHEPDRSSILLQAMHVIYGQV